VITSPDDEMLTDAERAEARTLEADAPLARALEGAFAAHPFDARLAAKISAAAKASRGSGRIVRPPVKPAPLVERWRLDDETAPSESGRRRVERTLRTYAVAAALLVAGGLAVALFGPGVTPRGGVGGGGAAIEVASITATTGAGACVIRGGGEGYAPEGRALPLRAGDRVRAERRSVEIALAGGGSLLVRSDTTVEVRPGGVAIVDGPGVIALAFDPKSGSGKDFRVETPDGVTAHVRGTRFCVRFDGDRTVTTVLEGAVAVSVAPRGERAAAGDAAPREVASVEVGAGRALTIRRGSVAPLRPSTLTAALVREELAWTLWKEAQGPADGVAAPVPAGLSSPAAARPAPDQAPVAAPSGGSYLPLGAPSAGTRTSGDMPMGAPRSEGE